MSRVSLEGVKVGDTLIVHMTWEREKRERAVTKVGRRWVHTEGGHKFDIETGQSENHYGRAMTVHAYNEDLEKGRCRDYLHKHGVAITHAVKVDVRRIYDALLPLFEETKP